MDKQLLLICALTFIIHLIGTLASRAHRRHSYAAAGPVQHPDAAVAHVELFPGSISGQARGNGNRPARCRRHAIAGLPLAAVLRQPGHHHRRYPAPTFQRAFCRAVEHFQVYRSVPKLLLHAVFKGGLSYLKTSASLPKPANVTGLRQQSGVSISIVIATALWTVGASLSTLHRRTVRRRARPQRARHLQHPVIDHQRRRHHHDGRLHRPVVSGMTDDVIEGKIEESQFRRAVVWLVGSRLADTLIAQFLLVPSAVVIVGVAKGL